MVSPKESKSSSSPNRSANAEPTSFPEISSPAGISWSTVSFPASAIAESRDCCRESIADSSTELSSPPSEARAANGSSSSPSDEKGEALFAGAVSSAGASMSMSRDFEKRLSSSAGFSSACGSAAGSAVTVSSASSAFSSACGWFISPRSGIAKSTSPIASAAAPATAPAATATFSSGSASYSSFQNVSSGSMSWTRRKQWLRSTVFSSCS